jgi:hypothetical protein
MALFSGKIECTDGGRSGCADTVIDGRRFGIGDTCRFREGVGIGYSPAAE